MFHAVLLGPAMWRSYPGDDTLILVPAVLHGVEVRPASSVLPYLFAPDLVLPGGLWKLYVLGTARLMGPRHEGFVIVGMGLHLVCSWLVWVVARSLSLGAGASVAAACLHFVAYPGFHAYVWPVGIQHVLTAMAVLSMLALYLRTEQRRRAGLPIAWAYAATALCAALGSLTRSTVATAALALLVHAVSTAGDIGERRRRFDLWAPIALVMVLYPLAVMVYGGERDVLDRFPRVADFLAGLLARVPPFVTYLYVLALATTALVIVRMLIVSETIRGLGRHAHVRRALGGLVLVAGAATALLITLVIAWGGSSLLLPLPLALTSYNAARWHFIARQTDLIAVMVGAATIVLFVRAPARRDATVLLGVLLASFGIMFHISGLEPNRYWIYVTPALAIAMAGAGERLWTYGAELDRRRRWCRVAMGVAAVLVLLTNIAAIRLELWRHRLTDTFLVLDYIRTGELIRQDLATSGAGRDAALCVNGLTAPSLDAASRDVLEYPAHPRSFRDHNAKAILAQALGRRDTEGIRLDCSDAGQEASVYTVSAIDVTRAGRSIDPFVAAYRRVLGLVGEGKFREARDEAETAVRRPPFSLRYLLDPVGAEDIEWLTNGASVFEWIDRLAASHDHWSWVPAPKIELLKTMLASELVTYVRLVFLREYLRARLAPPGDLVARAEALTAHRLHFRMATMTQVAAIVRTDPALASDSTMMTFLDNVVSVSPVWRPTRHLMHFGRIRAVTDPSFYAFLWRLVRGDVGLLLRGGVSASAEGPRAVDGTAVVRMAH